MPSPQLFDLILTLTTVPLMLQRSLSMLKLKPSDLILGVSEILNFSFFVYLKFMPSPQLFDLIPKNPDDSCECQGFKNRHRPDSYRDTLP